jgi:3-methyladenine DNA glycosylase Tag
MLCPRISIPWPGCRRGPQLPANSAFPASGEHASLPITGGFLLGQARSRPHADPPNPDDPAFFLAHLSHAVFEAGIWQAAQAKWDGIREAFHSFDPAQVAAMTPAEIAATESDPRVIRNKAKIQATVDNAREVLAILGEFGTIHAYFASFPDAHAASADMRRRFKFLGDTGVWRFLNGAARDIGG